MPTTNKSFDQPAAGSTNWDVPLNANFGYIDSALGETVSISVTGVTATPVVLTVAQYRCLILNFTGTLSANVTYQVPAGVGGEWIVNNSTSGAFTLTIDNVSAGTSVVVASGTKRLLYSDGTNINEVGAASAGGGSVTSVDVSGGSTGLTTSGGPVTTTGTITLAGTLAVANGGTGSTTATNARSALGLAIGTNVLAYDANLQSFVNTFTLPTADSTNGYFLQTNGAGTLSFAAAGGGGGGTVTSVAVSGGSTGLTTSGGPITTSGTITIAGTLAVANGGTGGTTQSAARSNLGITFNSILTGSQAISSGGGGGSGTVNLPANVIHWGITVSIQSVVPRGTASAPTVDWVSSGSMSGSIFWSYLA